MCTIDDAENMIVVLDIIDNYIYEKKQEKLYIHIIHIV